MSEIFARLPAAVGWLSADQLGPGWLNPASRWAGMGSHFRIGRAAFEEFLGV